MMTAEYPRQIAFDSVTNCRDLGGYRTRDGRCVARRRLFRSGCLHNMFGPDIARFGKIGLTSVLDLRTPREPDRRMEVDILDGAGVRYYNVPFVTGNSRERELMVYDDFLNMGEEYLYRIRHETFGRHVVEALEIIAEKDNLPLLFHCFAGKDRTGILAAILLGTLDVADEDIIEDYTLTAPHMEALYHRMKNDPATPQDIMALPGYAWEASAESMALFLESIRREYGSIAGYLAAQGADMSLVQRLKNALLV